MGVVVVIGPPEMDKVVNFRKLAALLDLSHLRHLSHPSHLNHLRTFFPGKRTFSRFNLPPIIL